MHSLGLNVRLAALVLLIVGAVVALFASGSGVSAQTTLDVEGVYCIDLWFHGTTPPTKGQAHIGNLRSAKVMIRIEPAKSLLANAWDITTVGYNAAGDPIPTIPPSADTCKVKADGNTLAPEVPPQDLDAGNRPQVQDVLLTAKPEGKALRWVSCTDTAAGLEEVWVRTEWNLLLDPGQQTFGDQANYLDVTPPTVTNPPGNDCGTNASPLYTVLEATPRVATKGAPGAGADDWDGDGISDWDELAPGSGVDLTHTLDPFVAASVGGVAELPDAATAPLETAGSSSNTGLIAAIAAVAAMAAIAVGGSAWYVQRRRLR